MSSSIQEQERKRRPQKKREGTRKQEQELWYRIVLLTIHNIYSVRYVKYT